LYGCLLDGNRRWLAAWRIAQSLHETASRLNSRQLNMDLLAGTEQLQNARNYSNGVLDLHMYTGVVKSVHYYYLSLLSSIHSGNSIGCIKLLSKMEFQSSYNVFLQWHQEMKLQKIHFR
jgi:hypothetical protein